MTSINIALTNSEAARAAVERREEQRRLNRAANTAALAMGLGLAGMTWDRWLELTPAERDRLRDTSMLTPQLKGLEGHRVEVIDNYGERRRFWVRVSTGWQPIHLEVKQLNSSGGTQADKSYQSVVIVTTPHEARRKRSR